MDVNVEELRALSVADKLDLVEMLWDDIGASSTPMQLPAWVEQEATRRLKELANNPTTGLTHEEVWRRIDGR